MNKITIYHNDNLEILKQLPNEYVNLIYIDPPFNTGKKQYRKRFKTINGQKSEIESFGYEDKFENFIDFIKPRLEQSYRILKNNGSLFFHLDYREVHYCKVLLDEIFGRDSFINELIWVYDYGARSKSKWSCKHDNILWYAKNPKNYIFKYDEIERIPYMAPNLVGKEKAEKGKTLTDVWWHTIVPTNGKEKVNYSNQKPLGIINRIIKVHSNENDLLLDFFAGSGTLGESAYLHNRNCILIDKNLEAINVMKKRFENFNTEFI